MLVALLPVAFGDGIRVAGHIELGLRKIAGQTRVVHVVPDRLTSGYDLTGTILSGANLTSVTGLASRDFSGYDFTNTNFTNVNLTNTNLAGATLRGANLTGVIGLTYRDFTGYDFTGTNFTNVDLTRANLTNANLSRAELAGANIISTKLTGAVWSDTGCPWGGKSSTRCSAFATRPAPGFDTNKSWYQYRSPTNGAIPAGTPLAGTIGAPIGNRPWGPFSSDGVKGAVKNFSTSTVLIRSTGFRTTYDAILEPGAQMSYVLDSSTNDAKESRSLLIYAIDDNGQPVGSPTRLYLSDNFFVGVDLKFWPSGYSGEDPQKSAVLNVDSEERLTWPDGNPTTKLWVKREKDGWLIPVSPEYLARHTYPINAETKDWGVVSIHIDGVPAV